MQKTKLGKKEPWEAEDLNPARRTAVAPGRKSDGVRKERAGARGGRGMLRKKIGCIKNKGLGTSIGYDRSEPKSTILSLFVTRYNGVMGEPGGKNQGIWKTRELNLFSFRT